MLVPLFVAVANLATLEAIEHRRVQPLHDKPVDVFAQVRLAAATGARLATFLPVSEAGSAEKLVAVATLLGVLDDGATDLADEMSVNRLFHSLLRFRVPTPCAQHSLFASF